MKFKQGDQVRYCGDKSIPLTIMNLDVTRDQDADGMVRIMCTYVTYVSKEDLTLKS